MAAADSVKWWLHKRSWLTSSTGGDLDRSLVLPHLRQSVRCGRLASRGSSCPYMVWRSHSAGRAARGRHGLRPRGPAQGLQGRFLVLNNSLQASRNSEEILSVSLSLHIIHQRDINLINRRTNDCSTGELWLKWAVFKNCNVDCCKPCFVLRKTVQRLLFIMLCSDLQARFFFTCGCSLVLATNRL